MTITGLHVAHCMKSQFLTVICKCD